MDAGKNASTLRQGFSITSAAKKRRTAVEKRIFLQFIINLCMLLFFFNLRFNIELASKSIKSPCKNLHKDQVFGTTVYIVLPALFSANTFIFLASADCEIE